MTVVGVSFTKILAEKIAPSKGKLNVGNNVKIQDVVGSDLSLGQQKQGGLTFTFLFTSKYEPKIGMIELTGSLVYIEDDKKIQEILKGWKSEKKIPDPVIKEIMNAILIKCNIQALVLSRDLNLPPSIPLPKVKAQ